MEGGRGGSKEGQAIWNKYLLLIKVKRTSIKIIIIWLVFVSADGSWRLERGEWWVGFVTIRKCGSGALYKLQLNGEVWKKISANDVARNVSMGHMG